MVVVVVMVIGTIALKDVRELYTAKVLTIISIFR